MTDWAPVSSLATAGGTLVLAAATFSAVRSSNRSARLAERSLLADLRPVLEHARRLYLTTTYADETWPGPLRDQVPRLAAAMLAEIRGLADVS